MVDCFPDPEARYRNSIWLLTILENVFRNLLTEDPLQSQHRFYRGETPTQLGAADLKIQTCSKSVSLKKIAPYAISWRSGQADIHTYTSVDIKDVWQDVTARYMDEALHWLAFLILTSHWHEYIARLDECWQPAGRGIA